MKNFFKRKKVESKLIIPGDAADKRISAIYSAYQQPGAASEYLLNLGLQFSERARSIDLQDISNRISADEINYINIFPGEHYKLLSAITEIMQPKLIVEIGTHLGYSSLCMKKYLPADSKLITFDLLPWNKFSNTILTPADFDHQLIQFVDDITQPLVFNKHQALLENADIIFMDALKDGVQENQFLENFSTINFKKKCLFVLDDIRLWNMLEIWYKMDKPKLDLTSFGHWSGTGLIEWN